MPHSSAATDKRVLATLKDVHNRGAGLYNAGDHAAAFRLYQGALLTARAFLDHRPAVRKVIDDGLHEVEAVGGNVRLMAFRLHEVIEQVRADLKAIWKAARVTGVVTAGGRPLPGVRVLLAPVAGGPLGETATAEDGTFALTAPPGEYAVTVSGPGVGDARPAPPRVALRPGDNPLRIDLS